MQAIYAGQDGDETPNYDPFPMRHGPEPDPDAEEEYDTINEKEEEDDNLSHSSQEHEVQHNPRISNPQRR
eukprot:CAMPEP_0197048916 /NCGR_PEP_ID=MMETSP1384-20130603/24183_1 /TAXON_ID=29189 /ORGANISM="Ammonia sp." /LENGTH=69 /DNA_ID=CAMNT_0042481123 /DNA_START=93 /DNA_END=298 /DNA_ORIENTATION=-